MTEIKQAYLEWGKKLAMLEVERVKLEYARERLNEAIAEKNFSTAEKLRELAVLATEETLRNDLIRQEAKILTGENFS